MAQQRVLYSEAVEGFFTKAVGKKLSRGARNKLKDAGLDLDQKLKPMYALELFQNFVHIARQDLHPGLSDAEAYRRIGEDTITGYGETVIGKAMLSMARLIGPVRLLTRMDANVKGVNNFTRTRLTMLGEKDVEYWFNELSVNPHYTMGLLRAGLTACGAKEPQVEYLAGAEPHTFRLRWS